ncbi:hypothetical protein AMS59_13665 [Lysinibacillus sp. FJAT-14745]|uniref:hypothetical protein n=1 Tax=Lysinibacillus sp. FJAT-14745 TaxID=1704289 RepID=UPI0006AB95A8|nr:hypothetical protein [Lysinibacillus sp. FJAT-14745]KOP78143.1 hypothetical protein AMS59_13665 [Lysinibacillus sp. FJAT-14745]
MDTYDYIEAIALELKASTDYNFQFKVGEIFKVYSKYKNLTYEMPNTSGGDDKNDGWLVEEKKFFQIYSPQQLRDSLKKDIQSKFSEDLSKLLELIYRDGKWGGDIKEFIFIVNTFDRNLPHDSIRYFETQKDALEQAYNTTFEVQVVNVDYIKDVLEELDLASLRSISSRLRITSIIDYNALSAKLFYQLIDILNEGIQRNYRGMLDTNGMDYKRISSPLKISLNGLDEIGEHIESIILELGVLESIINSIYQDMDYVVKFERIIAYIIELYDDLSQQFEGVELYNEIKGNLIGFSEFNKSFEYPTELLMVYIFDKCEIFEKEEVG